MTRIDFYSGASDKLRTVCKLSHKAMQGGMRVVVHVPDTDLATALDRLLWQYPSTAFMPHCRSEAAEAAEMPVVLDTLGISFPHSEILISLHSECLPFFSRFEQVVEIVGQTDDDKRAGRERWRFYSDRGYELTHTDLRSTDGDAS